jgi:glycerophosphoryl diester phosphodiesterase
MSGGISPSPSQPEKTLAGTIVTHSLSEAPVVPRSEETSQPTIVTKRPWVIAHRGASRVAPENTLAAWRVAAGFGVDMIECDVRLSSDRVPVLMHDATLLRTTGHPGRVSDFTVAELQQMDVGSWFDPSFSEERIPTLRQALESIDPLRRVIIELKDPGCEIEVLDAIRQSGVNPTRIVIFSLYEQSLQSLLSMEPSLGAAWLVEEFCRSERSWKNALRGLLRINVSALALPVSLASSRLINMAHRFGLVVYVWTVNNSTQVEALITDGVEGIISDIPDMVQGICNQ